MTGDEDALIQDARRALSDTPVPGPGSPDEDVRSHFVFTQVTPYGQPPSRPSFTLSDDEDGYESPHGGVEHHHANSPPTRYHEYSRSALPHQHTPRAVPNPGTATLQRFAPAGEGQHKASSSRPVSFQPKRSATKPLVSGASSSRQSTVGAAEAPPVVDRVTAIWQEQAAELEEQRRLAASLAQQVEQLEHENAKHQAQRQADRNKYADELAEAKENAQKHALQMIQQIKMTAKAKLRNAQDIIDKAEEQLATDRKGVTDAVEYCLTLVAGAPELEGLRKAASEKADALAGAEGVLEKIKKQYKEVTGTLRDENNQKQHVVDILRDDLMVKSGELAAARSRIADLEAQNTNYLVQMSSASKGFEHADKLYEKLSALHETLHTDAHGSLARAAELERLNLLAEGRSARDSETIALLKTQLAEETTKLKATIAEQNQKIEELSVLARTRELDLNCARADHAALDAQHKEAVKRLEASLAGSAAQLKTFEGEMRAKLATKEEHEKRLSARYEAQGKDLADHKKKSQDQLQKLSKEKDAMGKQINELETKLKAERADSASRERVMQEKHDKELATQQASSDEKLAAQLAAHVEAQSKLSTDIQQTKDAYEATLEEMRSAASTSSERIKALTADGERTSAELRQAQEELEAASAEIKRLAEAETAHASTIAQQASKAGERDRRVEELAARVAELEGTLAEVEGTLVQVRESAEALREEKAEMERRGAEKDAETITDRYQQHKLTPAEQAFMQLVLEQAASLHGKQLAEKDNENHKLKSQIRTLEKHTKTLEGQLSRQLDNVSKARSAAGLAPRSLVEPEAFASSDSLPMDEPEPAITSVPPPPPPAPAVTKKKAARERPALVTLAGIDALAEDAEEDPVELLGGSGSAGKENGGKRAHEDPAAAAGPSQKRTKAAADMPQTRAAARRQSMHMPGPESIVSSSEDSPAHPIKAKGKPAAARRR